eukprot:UN10601
MDCENMPFKVRFIRERFIFFPLKHEMHPQNSDSTLLHTALFL